MNINHQQREVLLTIREAIMTTAAKGSDEFEEGGAKIREMLLMRVDWLLEQVNAGHSIPLTVKVNPKWPFDAQVVRTNPPPTYAKPPAPLAPPPMAAAPEQPTPQPPAGWKLVPVEPTPEMLKAAKDSTWIGGHYASMAYRAMLAAAPQQSAPQPLTEDEAVAALQKLSYAAGAAYGWNCCANGDEAGFQRSQDTAEALRVLRDRKAPQQSAPQPLAYYYPGSDVEIPSVALAADLTDEQKRNCIPLVPGKVGQ